METSPFSVDLVLEAKNHIQFLSALHKNGVTLSRPSLESFRRYTNLWLPMLMRLNSNGKSCDLIPPADIAWLFHCHRLAPYRYSAYVQKRFFQRNNEDAKKKNREDTKQEEFKGVDASHPFVFQLQDNSCNDTLTSPDLVAICKSTIQHFDDMYPNENFFLLEPSANKTSIPTAKKVIGFNVVQDEFDVMAKRIAELEEENDALKFEVDELRNMARRSDSSTDTPKSNSSQTISPKLDGFDLLESCERQSTFLWQVSSPTFSSDVFLKQGVENYDKFVRLMGRKDRPRFIVPTYQIDLMWHTHMLSSIEKYHHDNMEMSGSVLEHDDSLNDRSEGSILNNNFEATRRLWKNVYGVEYIVPGGMYRGEPPKRFFRKDWVDNKWFDKPNMDIASHGGTTWLSIDDPIAFIPANPSITTFGCSSANPKVQGYIFGKGAKGIGYYNLNCRETYDFLLDRIEKELKKEISDRENLIIVSLPLLGIPYICCGGQAKEKKIAELKLSKKKFTRIRKYAAGPDHTTYYWDAAACGAAGVDYDSAELYAAGAGRLQDSDWPPEDPLVVTALKAAVVQASADAFVDTFMAPDCEC